MSGKAIVAALLAVSTASAATVGVVYTGVVSPRVGEPPAASEIQSLTGALKSAVVLNAQEGSFDRSADSGEAPVCPSQAPTGCVMVSGASALRVNILGYTVTIPPVWLGGDSEDQYFAEGNDFPWLEDGPSFFGPWTAIGRRRASIGSVAADADGGDPTTSSQSQDQSWSGSQPGSTILNSVVVSANPNLQVLSQGIGLFGATPIPDAALGGSPRRGDSLFPPDVFPPAPASIYGANPSADPTTPPLAASPPAVPFLSGETTIRGDAPEASTWLLTIAGFATLAVFKRRRIVSALRSAR